MWVVSRLAVRRAGVHLLFLLAPVLASEEVPLPQPLHRRLVLRLELRALLSLALMQILPRLLVRNQRLDLPLVAAGPL